MKRAKQVLALLLSLALLLGLCGLAEEPVEAAEIAEPIEELIEEAPAEEAEAPAEEELPAEEAPVEEPEEAPVEMEPVEEAPAEEALVEEIPAEEESVEMESFGVEDLGAYDWPGEDLDIPGVTSLTIPEGYSSIAPEGCLGLRYMTNVSLPSTLKSIGKLAFLGCWYLPSIDIPSGVTIIDKYAFGQCKALTTVSLPEGLTTIGEYAFDKCESLRSIRIPSPVKELTQGLFHDCTALYSVELPEELEEIGPSVFFNCSSLVDITLPEKYSGGLGDVFYGCSSLKEMVIPKGVTNCLGSFIGCTSLETVTFPEKMNSLVSLSQTFWNCTNLKAVYLPKNCSISTDETLTDDNGNIKTAFYNCPNVTVYLYKGTAAETFCNKYNVPYKYRTGDEDATVSLPVGSIILSQKESQTIKPTTEGLKKKEKYKFTSSDPTVAAVSATTGKITAKGPGTATITATGKTSGASASCTVTVLPAPVSATITGAPESATLNLGGEPLQLGVTVEPAEAPQEVTWKSSKPKIASVDKNSGLVTALKEGKTTITATAKHKNLKGKSVTKKFTLTVVDPKRPTAIHVDPEMQTELVMTDGQQVTMPLKYALEPAETAETEVTWSIPKKAHKSYASVTKEGELTAKKAGKVQVKVTAKKKSAAGKTLSDTIEITIVDPTIPTSVTITEADGTQIKKGEKLTLHATCAPETAANAELEWSSSNKKVVKVDKLTGEITAVKPGKAKITAKAKKGGQKASITIQVIK